MGGVSKGRDFGIFLLYFIVSRFIYILFRIFYFLGYRLEYYFGVDYRGFFGSLFKVLFRLDSFFVA